MDNNTPPAKKELDQTPFTISVKRACRVLDVGQTTLWAMIRDGKLRVVRLGGRTLVIYASIPELLSSLQRAATPSKVIPRKRNAGKSVATPRAG